MYKFILTTYALLFFILPIPHTIAIRYSLSGILLFNIAYITYKNKIKLFQYKEIKLLAHCFWF